VALLRDQSGGLLKAVANGLYVFWIGSGISRNRAPDVKKLVDQILVFLQSNINASDNLCPHRRAFETALDLAELSQLEQEHTDMGKNIREWPTHGAIVNRLSNKYSELLDIDFTGRPPDYLLWEVVDPAATYGVDLSEPDAEHYCLAVLVLEGALPEIVSPNWDGLIEKAVEDLAGTDSSAMTVCVTSEDFRSPSTLSRILKFHGCAVRAGADAATYREYLVGRRSQITSWPTDDEHQVMRAEMILLAAKRRTLMIGLSAQDWNIQDLFAAAKSMLAWQWPISPPAFVFAEDAIGNHQTNILRVAYGNSYEGNHTEIASLALVRAFAKPLLFALTLGVIGHKIEALAKGAWGTDNDGVTHQSIASGISAVLSTASGAIIDQSDLEARRVISHLAKTMALLRDGRPPQAELRYQPISNSPAHVMATDPNILAGGLPHAALALAVLGTESEEGTWEMSVSGPSSSGNWAPVTLKADTTVSRLFFAADASVAVQLELGDFVDSTDGDVVVVHSARRPQKIQRSPTAAPGRTGAKAARHVDMAEILDDSPNYLDVRRRFREELTL